MEEIRSVSDSEKNRFSHRIYSDRLLKIGIQCSEDGAWSKSTGNMYYEEAISKWLVEYICPLDNEIFRRWTLDEDALTKQIAEEILDKKDAGATLNNN